MSIPKRINHYLVEGDDEPMTVRFTGLDLADYSAINMHIYKDTAERVTRAVTPIGVTDPEAGTVAWQTGDLTRGVHVAEFELTDSVSSKKITLPQRYLVNLIVRPDIA